MTTAVAPKEAASTQVADNPFPVLPGNESLDGSIAGAEAAAEVTTDNEPKVEGAIETQAGTEGGAEAAAETDPNATKVDPAKPAKLWAEQYKTPEELEIAHKHSSAEGKRLATRVKEIEASSAKQVSDLQAQLAELQMQVEIGPEIKEPTDEELEAMGPIKAARMIQKLGERKATAAKLKEKQEARAAEQKRWESDTKASIDNAISKMLKDGENFPDYRELTPAILEIADAVPWATGNPDSAQLLYFAAFGRRALSKLGEAKAKTKESEATAKATAAAAATATATAGSGAGTKDPVASGKQAPKPGSDEAVNQGMQAAWARKNPSLI